MNSLGLDCQIRAKNGDLAIPDQMLGTLPFIFSGDEGMDVGPDTGLRVTEDEPKGQFTGEIGWVQLDLGIEDYDHFLTPEERYRAAMMRQ